MTFANEDTLHEDNPQVWYAILPHCWRKALTEVLELTTIGSGVKMIDIKNDDGQTMFVFGNSGNSDDVMEVGIFKAGVQQFIPFLHKTFNWDRLTDGELQEIYDDLTFQGQDPIRSKEDPMVAKGFIRLTLSNTGVVPNKGEMAYYREQALRAVTPETEFTLPGSSIIISTKRDDLCFPLFEAVAYPRILNEELLKEDLGGFATYDGYEFFVAKNNIGYPLFLASKKVGEENWYIKGCDHQGQEFLKRYCLDETPSHALNYIPLRFAREKFPNMAVKCFRSGGGLVVMDARDENGETIGYSESPFFHEALRILEDDILAGGREYKEVYGPLEPHYFTGSFHETPFQAVNDLGNQAYKLYFQFTGEEIKAVQEGYISHHKDLCRDEVLEKGSLQYEFRGVTFEAYASGDGIAIKTIHDPENKSSCFFHNIWETSGNKFWNVLANLRSNDGREPTKADYPLFGMF
jgi:hypothetical protein